jgi:hypothetical protein
MKKVFSKLVTFLFLGVIVIFILKSQLGDKFLPQIDSFLKKREPVYDKTFVDIDKYALATPASEEKTIATLAKYLGAQAKTDKDKARAIFVWVTDRIMYDVAGYRDKSFEKKSQKAEDVFVSRLCVCAGFASLYKAIADEMGLTCEYITGDVKAECYTAGKTKSGECLHAWNAVKIDGQWQLVDATFGQGFLQSLFLGLGESNKKAFAPQWFLVNPYTMIYSHLPTNEKWQLQSPKIDYAKFDQLPTLRNSSAEFSEELKKDMFALAIQKQEIPGMGRIRFPLSITAAPLEYKLNVGTAYNFAINSPHIQELYIEEKGEKKYFSQAGEKYELSYTPSKKKAFLTVYVKAKNQKMPAIGLLSYRVN